MVDILRSRVCAFIPLGSPGTWVKLLSHKEFMPQFATLLAMPVPGLFPTLGATLASRPGSLFGWLPTSPSTCLVLQYHHTQARPNLNPCRSNSQPTNIESNDTAFLQGSRVAGPTTAASFVTEGTLGKLAGLRTALATCKSTTGGCSWAVPPLAGDSFATPFTEPLRRLSGLRRCGYTKASQPPGP
ncbi:unnamed protein product [Discula destructiva]